MKLGFVGENSTLFNWKMSFSVRIDEEVIFGPLLFFKESLDSFFKG